MPQTITGQNDSLFDSKKFDSRKKDHILYSTSKESQFDSFKSASEQIQLLPTAFPEINLNQVKLNQILLGESFSSPHFISSMTGGHESGFKTNDVLASCAAEKNWLMGVGSQRKELADSSYAKEWTDIKKKYPKLKLMANIGLSQLIEVGSEQIERLIDSCQAIGVFVHSNPLQEAVQKEGTPNFEGGLKALEALCAKSSVPVVLKEVGFGITKRDLLRVNNFGLAAVDISGAGGTHWSKVEALRDSTKSFHYDLGMSFNRWGQTSAQILNDVSSEGLKLNFDLWASGGVRSGVDSCALLAAGAQAVGVASPLMKAALAGPENLLQLMKLYDEQLRVSMFNLGVCNVKSLKDKSLWKWKG